MLLLLPQGTAGTVSKGVTDTASLSGSEGNLSDFSIETLDTASVNLGEVIQPAVRVDRAEFALLALSDVSSVLVSGTTAKAGTDTISISVDETATPSVVAVVLEVTDDADIEAADASTLDVGQIAVDVTDDASIAAEDFAFAAGVADIVRDSGDAISIRLEDAGVIVEIKPVAIARFTAKPDAIRFSTQ